MAKEPAAKPAPAETVTVRAKTPIEHDQVRYEIDATIAMTPAQADALVELGAAEIVAAPPAPAA
ncbi:MAG: hypothetical protein K2X74_15855 [Acetobacteraceae bacterium]|nr:hypothetical protein [Acetobacteraceae bacterium]